MNSQKLDEQKELIEKYQNTSMSSEKFTLLMDKIESKFSALRENIDEEQSRVIDLMDTQQQKSIADFAKNHASDPEMTLVWGSSPPKFEMK